MAPTPSLRGPSGAVQDRMLGRVLGARYRVLSRLGEGGMGTVYLCEHAVLGRRYAVKVLRPELCADEELAERFRNEAIAASRIGGDNVVDVLDFGAEDDGALYYVMEALEGRSLGAILSEEGPLEVGRALDLLHQICRALAAAHARGVIHRDVKPDNVFVVRRPDGSERAKVIDFGISQVPPEAGKDRITRAGVVIGTPEYMAPEQAAGDPVDERADVYALGVLAYELLTGTLPIVALTPVATLVAHQTRAPVPPSRRRPAVPPEVDRLVLRALEKRPQDRPPSMAAFAAAIEALGGAGPVARTPAEAGPAGIVSPRPRVETVALPGSRRPTGAGRRTAAIVALAAVVGAALVAATAAGIAWWRVERGRGVAATPGATATPTAIPTATAIPTPTAIPTAIPTPTATAKPPSTSTTTTTTKTKTKTKTKSAAAPAGSSPAPAEEPDGVGVLKDPYR